MNTYVEVLVNDRPVKQHTHKNNTYIEARAGTEYSIKVRNTSFGRKLAVITVDGLNVISGEPQGDGVGQGYIIGARDSVTIKGFRKDMSSVGAFKFCKKSGAYCNEQGLKGNNGVIGVRLYDEKYVPTVFYKSSPMFGGSTPRWNGVGSPGISISEMDNSLCRSVMDSNTTASYSSQSLRDIKCCASNASAPSFDLGTTWGKQINDSVKQVEFDNVDTSEDHIIYYDSRENLEAIGVTFIKENHVAFPKAFGNFASPPKGWKG
jgi:hypothetical protein